ncbi:MAG: hypothetical protein JSS79_12290 [Bacteroidetes bacterium]|nr:hypothetical protein [Bacteroidota bacterium]
MTPTIKVIGIYRVENFEDVHLVEINANVPPSKLEVGEITQEVDGHLSSSWQSPWEEKYLDESGQKVIGDFSSVPLNCSTTRLLFYFHYLNFDKTLKTQFGEIKLSQPTALPDRLNGLVNYEQPD